MDDKTNYISDSCMGNSVILTAVISYWAILKVGEDDPRYAIDNIAKTSQITAYDIAYMTGKEAGSTYVLGELGGSFASMVKLLPSAINVSLFRPYLWEVRNPLMLLAAVESFVILLLTIFVLYRTRVTGIFNAGTKPIVFFSLLSFYTP